MEAKISFLEMIQGIIARMSSNSFMLKGWAVTLFAGIYVLSDKDANAFYFLIAYIPVALFWFLDSYYLMLERQYKHLYDLTADKKPGAIDFKIYRPEPNSEKKTMYHQSLFSKTELLFYMPMALLIIIVVFAGPYFTV